MFRLDPDPNITTGSATMSAGMNKEVRFHPLETVRTVYSNLCIVFYLYHCYFVHGIDGKRYVYMKYII